MSSVARSGAAFAVYLFGVGLTLVAVPATFTDLTGLPSAPDVYLRVLGILAAAIGLYFGFATRNDDRAFFASSVYVRAVVFVAFTVIGLTAGEPMLIAIGAADVVFATWTWVALRSDPA